ncbi:16S rRNA (uracil(1498)-N(3))-methyltransferase [Demequina litorisediminis]|uniref:Ribosomal RNA small subunit methyltransferase E n=1 Tax=Demequina litorisediminis TaxID=1849022 RepID=A0ABQ6IB49_9MICO|nr:16S rRNA (uracil(1498)-N(3))-methyltransferase [Demequina litorisediminis]GMA34207.1 ribosomal RNA small subunit methyltransferase E [Demequina litorisediminis]
MSAPVFVDAQASDAAVGSVVTVTGAEARHAVTVQRRAVGEIVDVVDGQGRRVRGEIVATGTDSMTVAVSVVTRDDDPPVTLVQALAKGGRDEQAVEAAVELGVTAVVPWSAQRSIVQWRGPKAEKARQKWADLVWAATKQSRRATLAPVAAVVTSRELAVQVASATASGVRVLILHEESATPLTTLTWADPAQPVWIVVGPEGGIGDEEVALLTDAGAESVVLGQHVLRASSAGPAAIAALAATRGTWADAALRGGLR